MEIQLLFIILLPLAGFLFEAILPRFFKKSEGFSSILFSVLTVSAVLFFCSNFNLGSRQAQFIYDYAWISDWKIDFKLALDGAGCIGIMLMSIIFLITSIISKSDKKSNSYFPMIMLLEASIMGFLLSYDFILKILFWEVSWVPVFFLLIADQKKRFSILYLKYWFSSEILIIIASILLFNISGMSYDIEKITLTQLGASNTATVIFFMLIAGCMIRACLFPFDRCISRSTRSCDYNTSIIIGVAMSILPFFFIATVVLPIFQRELNIYTDIIAIISILSILICAIRLFIDKRISTIMSSQIIVFNAMSFVWLIRPAHNLINAFFEIIVIKALLNIIIIYFGRAIILGHKERRSFDLWMFAIALALSFGLPGILMINPLFTLLSSWYGIAPYVSISLVVLLMFTFLYSFINIASLFGTQENTKVGNNISTNNIVLVLVMLVSLIISIAPYYIHDLSGNYHRTFIERVR